MACVTAQIAPAHSRIESSERRIPSRLEDFHGIHNGETIVVCGCGTSLQRLAAPERFITIGVNDVGRMFQPDYLVVLNPREQFRGDRFSFVERSQAKAIFSQLKLGIRHPNVVPIRLGKMGGVDFSDRTCLHYTRNSPYLALCLAVHMGAKRIGLIGVDFTDDHFFGHTGQHPLSRHFSQIDQEYRRLYDACTPRGIEVVNLSDHSRLTALPKISLEEFAAAKDQPKPLNLVSYATTPIAGVPSILARCISAATKHSARSVWATNSYPNGVGFQGDVEWQRVPGVARELLEAADAVIVHNGKVDPRHRELLRSKPVITMAHNYIWNVDTRFVSSGLPGVVVGQYQATLAEFEGWHAVPNPLPFWEPDYQPEIKPEKITICYTPSGKHERYPRGHRLYWHSKGYATTIRVLRRLAERFGIRLEVVGDQQVTHAESLAMKRRSHIAIDECVTGSYHRNSLEGLACGCVVVNGVGILPEVEPVFRSCAGDGAWNPFVFSTLDNLESVLTRLIEGGAHELTAQGVRNRAFMEQHWNFRAQWNRHWEPVMTAAFRRAPAPRIRVAKPVPSRQTTVFQEIDEPEFRQGVSVVICHGGQERMPHLRASLANLRQCAGVDEVIVVDMGQSPYAEEIARRWADKYVFVRNDDVFERARCLNVGTSLAEHDLVFWSDNDLIFPPNFISTAVTEMRSRTLTYLLPYTSVRYLSESDTHEVMRGGRNPAECKPVKTLRAIREVSGGAGLVRKSFVARYGGMSEEFRGWGGEDTAWWFKARLLGSVAGTRHQDQFLFHLYHPGSGNYGGNAHINDNPYYAQNVTLLREMVGIRDPRTFGRRFPPAATISPVWQGRRLKFIVPLEQEQSASLLSRTMQRMWGMQIDFVVAGAHDSPWKSKASDPAFDALVIFSDSLARRFLADATSRPLHDKTIAVSDGCVLGGTFLAELPNIGAVWTANPSVLSTLKKSGLVPWGHSAFRGAKTTFSDAAGLLQPLSLILGGAMPRPSKTAAIAATQVPQTVQNDKASSSSQQLPVWLYWEGKCPEWIRQCQQTIFAHAADVRLLSPEDFDKLWSYDRDIDLNRLQIAHRADFIRAFLLARYGGLWLDSDTIVMKPLSAVFDALRGHEFLAHREHTGYVPNGFIAAPSGSHIAATFYKRVCEILRTRKQLGWISIGAEPLTKLLNANPGAWHEMPASFVEPVPWNDPATFFAVDDLKGHEAKVHRDAICYTISNCEVQKFKAANPSRDLLNEKSFFRHLIALSLKHEDVRTKAPTEVRAEFRHIPFCIESLIAVSPKRVLDIGVGLGRWGVLVREFGETEGRVHNSKDWTIHIEGLRSSNENEPCISNAYNHLQVFDGALSPQKLQGHWDLAIVSEDPKLSRQEKAAILDRALDVADYVMAESPFTENGRPGAESGIGKLADFLTRSPVRSTVISQPSGEAHGAFLLSRNDPKHLGTAASMHDIFHRVLEEYRPFGDESLSGPGSTLARTVEIRRSLPLLVEDMGIRTMLDAPCGDFHWMQRVVLALDQYTGVDIVPGIIEHNQGLYGEPNRNFRCLDLTRDPLPEADMIFCRDCLPHFSFEDIFGALRNFSRSKSKYLLTTSFVDSQANEDIATGDWRPVNFQRAPFHFPQPLRIIHEQCDEAGGRYRDKSLLLWKLQEIL